MPQTSNSASQPYLSAPQLFGFYAQQLIADMLKANSNSPRPSYLSMIDPANPYGMKLIQHMSLGAGELESACSVAKRYTPLDLQNLTGVSQILLQGLNAARALWSLYAILKPGTARPQDCPRAVESAQMLKELRDGEKIFTYVESEQAGLPSAQAVNPWALLPGQSTIVGRLVRLYPSYGLNAIRGSEG